MCDFLKPKPNRQHKSLALPSSSDSRDLLDEPDDAPPHILHRVVAKRKNILQKLLQQLLARVEQQLLHLLDRIASLLRRRLPVAALVQPIDDLCRAKESTQSAGATRFSRPTLTFARAIAIFSLMNSDAVSCDAGFEANRLLISLASPCWTLFYSKVNESCFRRLVS